MEKYFLPYKLALELKKLGFDEPCLAGYNFKDRRTGQFTYPSAKEPNTTSEARVYHKDKKIVGALLYQQIIDWFEKEHNIFIGKTCYDDGKTPKRWVYHVDSYYVQEQSYDGAIRYAIDKIKNTQL
jgi:hypothetical protein